MRLTSRSSSGRSKKRLRDHGRMLLSRVAMTDLSAASLMAVLPSKLIDVTCTSPVSRHADAARASAMTMKARISIGSRGVSRPALLLAGARGFFRAAAGLEALPEPLHE